MLLGIFASWTFVSLSIFIITFLLAFHGKEGQQWIVKRTTFSLRKGIMSELYIAACSRDIDEVCKLLVKGVDVNARDDDGKTPLHGAARNGRSKIVALLLENGADVNAQDKDGLTPLHNATGIIPLAFLRKSSFGTTTALLILGDADVNLQDNNGLAPLHYAARRGLTDIAALLVASGAEVNMRNKDGATPLSEAVRTGHKATEKLLIQQGGIE